MLILNLKNYPQTVGENIFKLLEPLNELVMENARAKELVMVAVPTIQLSMLKAKFPNLNIISQTVNNKALGSTTGWTPAESLKAIGVEYSLFNHSEHRLWNENVVEDIKKIQEAGLKVIACCESIEEAGKLVEASPFAIAFEPAELIGSGYSVTNRPDDVKRFIEVVGDKSNALIGAGVSTNADTQASLDFGAKGVLLASAYVKAENPKAKALELLEPFL